MNLFFSYPLVLTCNHPIGTTVPDHKTLPFVLPTIGGISSGITFPLEVLTMCIISLTHFYNLFKPFCTSIFTLLQIVLRGHGLFNYVFALVVRHTELPGFAHFGKIYIQRHILCRSEDEADFDWSYILIRSPSLKFVEKKNV